MSLNSLGVNPNVFVKKACSKIGWDFQCCCSSSFPSIYSSLIYHFLLVYSTHTHTHTHTTPSPFRSHRLFFFFFFFKKRLPFISFYPSFLSFFLSSFWQTWLLYRDQQQRWWQHKATMMPATLLQLGGIWLTRRVEWWIIDKNGAVMEAQDSSISQSCSAICSLC